MYLNKIGVFDAEHYITNKTHHSEYKHTPSGAFYLFCIQIHPIFRMEYDFKIPRKFRGIFCIFKTKKHIKIMYFFRRNA